MDNADTQHQDRVWRSFTNFLQNSPRVLCLVGAGLSAPSGLATWRGAGGLWNNLSSKDLASPRKFDEDPATVWRFYGERLLEACAARPNAAHEALARLARWHGGWLTVNQNVDGLLEQTEHPVSTLLSIHGSLRTIRCVRCEYSTHVQDPRDMPFLQSLLAANPDDDPPTRSADELLPRCPNCAALLRPGVVWFGETLAAGAPDVVDEWIAHEHVDLVIAAGTSLRVFPAAEWVHLVRERGAALAVIDVEEDEGGDSDWFFQGDAAVTLPEIFDLVVNEEADGIPESG